MGQLVLSSGTWATWGHPAQQAGTAQLVQGPLSGAVSQVGELAGLSLAHAHHRPAKSQGEQHELGVHLVL